MWTDQKMPKKELTMAIIRISTLTAIGFHLRDVSSLIYMVLLSAFTDFTIMKHSPDVHLKKFGLHRKRAHGISMERPLCCRRMRSRHKKTPDKSDAENG